MCVTAHAVLVLTVEYGYVSFVTGTVKRMVSSDASYSYLRAKVCLYIKLNFVESMGLEQFCLHTLPDCTSDSYRL